MLKRVLSNYSSHYLSVWIILLFDMLLVWGLFLVALMIRYRIDTDILDKTEFVKSGLVKGLFVALLYGFIYVLFKVHRGILRHTTIFEAVLILKASSVALILGLIYSFAMHERYGVELIQHRDSLKYYPRFGLVIHFLLVVIILVLYRYIIRNTFTTYMKSLIVNNYKVMIYGAGSSGHITLNALRRDHDAVYKVIGFIDDDKNKIGKKIEGNEIFSKQKGLNKIEEKAADLLIISIQNMNVISKRKIIEECLRYDVKVKVVPPVEQWINEELTTNQIRNVKVEDLLGRPPITLDSKNIKSEVKGKVVMVTGAAGSIGSEIVRQLIHFEPQKIIALDQAESFLYDLQFEIKNNNPLLFPLINFIVADVKEIQRIQNILEKEKPQIIYHAAAYKHVPLMEEFPFEALKVNILATKSLADLAVKFAVGKFVMISTDKAVNPTNVMGTSKRISEKYIQSLNNEQEVTHFITTRFGNVLGSNGSVIPLFRKQIEKGGPITLTHKDITRYFMTIPEACNLVLEAGAMGKGGEIFVFDMGESIKIYDLALNMIKLSGFVPYKDIEIVEVGLRPGEKLYEELLNEEENTLPTHHKKIMKAKIRVENYHEIQASIIEMSHLSETEELTLVKEMKRQVPEFKSNNSRFEQLD